MELQCAVCFVNFDLDHHRPKSLPCGHTICKECVQNPGLQRKCPTCRKGLGRNIQNLPDNIIVMQLIEEDAALPRKKPRTEDTVVQLQQLQKGVDAGRKVVEKLRQVVPLAVEALNRQLDSSVAQLHQMEEALKQQVQRGMAGDEDGPPDLTDQLQLATQLEHSHRLLTTSRCSAVAEEEDGAAWRASVSVQPGGVGDVLRLVLLQLQTDGLLEKVDDVAVSATSFVGPPLISTLFIKDKDLDGGRLLVNDILRDRERWRDTRRVTGLKGEGSDLLLRVLTLQLEELEIQEDVTPSVMEEVQKMVSLKRLAVTCKSGDNAFPGLPLQLEELKIHLPSETQLRCVERMAGLRSLVVRNYRGPNVAFNPSRHGVLLWLSVGFYCTHPFKATMMSLIQSYSSSLQELQVCCSVSEEGDGRYWYFPDLGQDLAAIGLRSLRRLVLIRPGQSLCKDQVAACLLQRQNIRSFLPSSVEIACRTCKV